MLGFKVLLVPTTVYTVLVTAVMAVLTPKLDIS